MTVLLFQVAIFFSIVFARPFGPNATILVATGWTVESLVFLHYPPLLVLQLAVVWGTFALVEKRHPSRGSDSKRSIPVPADAVSDRNQGDAVPAEPGFRDPPAEWRGMAPAPRPPQESQVAADPRIGPAEYLSGTAHRSFLKDAVAGAQHRVIILSGWISAKVVDDAFLKLLKDRLDRGCDILIGYGYADGNGTHVESPQTKEVVERLAELAPERPLPAEGSSAPGAIGAPNGPRQGHLIMRKFPNHEKLLMIDDLLAVYGSNNWLSNASFANSERSIVLRDPAVARAEANRILQKFGRC